MRAGPAGEQAVLGQVWSNHTSPLPIIAPWSRTTSSRGFLRQNRSPDLGREDLVEITLNRCGIAISSCARAIHVQRKGNQGDDGAPIVRTDRTLQTREECRAGLVLGHSLGAGAAHHPAGLGPGTRSNAETPGSRMRDPSRRRPPNEFARCLYQRSRQIVPVPVPVAAAVAAGAAVTVASWWSGHDRRGCFRRSSRRRCIRELSVGGDGVFAAVLPKRRPAIDAHRRGWCLHNARGRRSSTALHRNWLVSVRGPDAGCLVCDRDRSLANADPCRGDADQHQQAGRQRHPQLGAVSRRPRRTGMLRR